MSNQLETKDGCRFEDLSDKSRAVFENIEVSICVFYNLPLDKREDYFRRIQNGVPLRKPEIIWSMTHPFMDQVRKIRIELIEIVSDLWETQRYADLCLFFNIATVIEGKSPVLRSENLKKWIIAKPTTENYEILGNKIRTAVKMLYSCVNTPLHAKLRMPVVLDLVTWIVRHDFQKPSEKKVTDFIKAVVRLISGEKETNKLANEYHKLLGVTSDVFIHKNFMNRYQVLESLLSSNNTK
jgi:hypothetical protein